MGTDSAPQLVVPGFVSRRTDVSVLEADPESWRKVRGLSVLHANGPGTTTSVPSRDEQQLLFVSGHSEIRPMWINSLQRAAISASLTHLMCKRQETV